MRDRGRAPGQGGRSGLPWERAGRQVHWAISPCSPAVNNRAASAGSVAGGHSPASTPTPRPIRGGIGHAKLSPCRPRPALARSTNCSKEVDHMRTQYRKYATNCSFGAAYRIEPMTYALRACSRALVAGSRSALASCSQVAAVGDRWPLMAVRGHLGDTHPMALGCCPGSA